MEILQLNNNLFDSSIHDNRYECDPLILTSSYLLAQVGKLENVDFRNENVTTYLGQSVNKITLNTSVPSSNYNSEGVDATFKDCKFKIFQSIGF